MAHQQNGPQLHPNQPDVETNSSYGNQTVGHVSSAPLSLRYFTDNQYNGAVDRCQSPQYHSTATGHSNNAAMQSANQD